MLKVLLINVNDYWMSARQDFRDLEMIMLPIGLIYIATYLKNKFKDKVEVRIIDRLIDYTTPQDLLNILGKYDPDVIGLRGVSICKELFHETAQIIKQYKKDRIIIGGGPYVTTDLQEAIKDKNIDYFVAGEGEVIFSEIIEKLLNNQLPLDVQGVAYRKNKKIFMNPPRHFIEDLDSLPYPDYNFISVDKYSKFLNGGYNRRKTGVIFTSRGCPFHCIYCHNIFGKEFRARSAENVFGEIESLYKNFKIRDFYIIDDNFSLDYQRAMKIFDLIINSNIKINMYMINGLRGDGLDYAFIDKMVKAGVIFVFFPIETASLRLQKFIKKNTNLERLTDNIHYACEKKIMVSSTIMVGFPTETQEEIIQSIEFLKQFKKITYPHFFIVKYYPGSEIYNLASENKFNLSNLRKAAGVGYHKIKNSATPLIPTHNFRELHFKYLQEVFLLKERLQNALEVQKLFLTEDEILDIYSLYFMKRIKDIQRDVLNYAT